MKRVQASLFLPKHQLHRAKQGIIYSGLLIALFAFLIGVYQSGIHISELEAGDITIDELPSALALSFSRMFISYIASLFFAFALGLTAARTKLGEKIIIPILDILQSIPVVGFFPAAIAFFISVTNGHRMGIELAAIFLIFTSQAWNIAFAVYEAVKSISQDNLDAIRSFGIRGSERFWKLYAPACVPRVIYNSMLSWSNGWFFLVACEIIAVGQMKYHLPGIGSFLSRAAEQNQIELVLWGLFALTTLILFLDFFIWRPASLWSKRFKQQTVSAETDEDDITESLPIHFMNRMAPLFPPLKKLIRIILYPFYWLIRKIVLPIFWDLPCALVIYSWIWFRINLIEKSKNELSPRLVFLKRIFQWLGWISIGAIALYSVKFLISILAPPWPDIYKDIPTALLASTGRLVIALIISIVWTVPVVLLVWNRPKLRRALTTIAQVGASLPAIALFPLIIMIAVKSMGGGMEISSIFLLLTGMQWYLLFNCLGGVATIPDSLAEATRSMGLRGWKEWIHLVLPAIRPAMITGAITAWGAGWNALVIAEYLTFRNETLQVHGIGALLNYSVYILGDTQAISLCIGAMIAWILLINILFWRPVYQIAIERYKF